VSLGRCLKGIRSLQHINLKDNSLAAESSDAILFLLKENCNIVHCNVKLNMFKYTALEELNQICKRNKELNKASEMPYIRREIRGLKKKRAEQGLFVEDLGKFRRQIKQGEQEIAVGLEEMSKVEDVI